MAKPVGLTDDVGTVEQWERVKVNQSTIGAKVKQLSVDRAEESPPNEVAAPAEHNPGTQRIVAELRRLTSITRFIPRDTPCQRAPGP